MDKDTEAQVVKQSSKRDITCKFLNKSLSIPNMGQTYPTSENYKESLNYLSAITLTCLGHSQDSINVSYY